MAPSFAKTPVDLPLLLRHAKLPTRFRFRSSKCLNVKPFGLRNHWRHQSTNVTTTAKPLATPSAASENKLLAKLCDLAPAIPAKMGDVVVLDEPKDFYAELKVWVASPTGVLILFTRFTRLKHSKLLCSAVYYRLNEKSFLHPSTLDHPRLSW